MILEIGRHLSEHHNAVRIVFKLSPTLICPV